MSSSAASDHGGTCHGGALTQLTEIRLHCGHIGNGYTCQGETPIRLQGRANGDHGIRQVVRLMTASGGLATRRTLLDA